MTRTAGKLGRKAKVDLGTKDLELFLRTPLPAAPPVGDLSGGIANDAWLMLGNGPDPTVTTWPNGFSNQGVGDCGPCSKEHRRLAAAARGKVAQSPAVNGQETVNGYAAYENVSAGGQDDGVSLQPYVQWLFQQGLIDGWATIGTDLATIRAAAQAFGGVLLGGCLTDNNMNQFNAGQPFTADGGQDPQLGHAVFYFAWNGTTDKIATWGYGQECEQGWIECFLANGGEAIVILTKEDAELGGVAFDALLAGLAGIGGQGVSPPPAPSPTPGPVPVTPPAPVPPAPSPPGPQPGVIGEIETLAEEAIRDIDQVVEDIEKL